jgi:hypothetical protein
VSPGIRPLHVDGDPFREVAARLLERTGFDVVSTEGGSGGTRSEFRGGSAAEGG